MRAALIFLYWSVFISQTVLPQRPKRKLINGEKEETVHECHHDKIMRPPEILQNQSEDGKDRVLQTNTYWAYSQNYHKSLEAKGDPGTFQPIRIQFDFSCKETSFIFSFLEKKETIF